MGKKSGYFHGEDCWKKKTTQPLIIFEMLSLLVVFSKLSFLSLFIFEDVKGRTSANTLNVVKKNSSILCVMDSSKRKREGWHIHAASQKNQPVKVNGQAVSPDSDHCNNEENMTISSMIQVQCHAYRHHYRHTLWQIQPSSSNKTPAHPCAALCCNVTNPMLVQTADRRSFWNLSGCCKRFLPQYCLSSELFSEILFNSSPLTLFFFCWVVKREVGGRGRWGRETL